MIRFKEFIERERPFALPNEIRDLASAGAKKTTLAELRVSVKEGAPRTKDISDEIFEKCEMLLIFDTKKQRTWLLATNQAFYCVIDVLEKLQPTLLWRIQKDKLVSNKWLNVQMRIEDNSATTGRIVINDKKPRLFNYRLFTDFPIEQRIKSMLMKAFDLPI